MLTTEGINRSPASRKLQYNGHARWCKMCVIHTADEGLRFAGVLGFLGLIGSGSKISVMGLGFRL